MFLWLFILTLAVIVFTMPDEDKQLMDWVTWAVVLVICVLTSAVASIIF